MFSFLSKSNPYMLHVGMTGVKMGDRLLQIGCSDAGALATIAVRVGLSGRAVAVVPDIATAVRARKSAARQGVLLDVDISSPPILPTDDAFDLVVIDDGQRQFATLDEAARGALVSQAVDILKPGGRLLVISAMPAEGLGAFFGGYQGPLFDVEPELKAGGCRFVRVLAEKEGLRFVEGTKARTAT